MRPLSVIMFDEQEWNNLSTRQCHLRKIHKLQLTDINYTSIAKCVILWNLKQTSQQHAWNFKNLKILPTNWKLTGAKAKIFKTTRNSFDFNQQTLSFIILLNACSHHKFVSTTPPPPPPPPLLERKKNPCSKKTKQTTTKTKQITDAEPVHLSWNL